MSGTAEPALRITPFLRCLDLVGRVADGDRVSHFVRYPGQRFRHSRCRNAPRTGADLIRRAAGRSVQAATGSPTGAGTASFLTERSAKKAPVGSTDITRIQASRLPVHLRWVWP